MEYSTARFEERRHALTYTIDSHIRNANETASPQASSSPLTPEPLVPYRKLLPSPLLPTLNIASPATGLAPRLPRGLPPGKTELPLVPIPRPLRNSLISSSFRRRTSSRSANIASRRAVCFSNALFSVFLFFSARSIAFEEALVRRSANSLSSVLIWRAESAAKLDAF